MGVDESDPTALKPLASEVLQTFERVAGEARRYLEVSPSSGSGALANVNTLTAHKAIERLEEIDRANRQNARTLCTEPAIARVSVEEDSGKKLTYYISRGAPLAGFPQCASYFAPVGRAASMPIGAEFTLPNGRTLTVLEKARLRPAELADGWESHDTVFESERVGPKTIRSLRELLREGPPEADPLERLLAQEEAESNVLDGIRRSVITKMELRDQPVLDQIQDEVFRLPLDRRLLILGPPGTGKTTTLIRRLGQKLDIEYLDDEEKALVESLGVSAHATSWLMFSPTDLLKQYLKEAFAREGVPASDLRIRTWEDQRRELARNVFAVLRTSSRSGFVVRDTLGMLGEDALSKPTEWFADFHAWQLGAFGTELQEAALLLSADSNHDLSNLGQTLANVLQRGSADLLTSTMYDLVSVAGRASELLSSLRAATEETVRDALKLQLQRNHKFVEELATFMDGLQAREDLDDIDADEADPEDEEDNEQPRSRAIRAVNAYMRAVRAQARAFALRRSLPPDSRNAKVLEWLAGRTLEDSVLTEVGMRLHVQQRLRHFTNPVKRYMDKLPQRYRTYRRLRRSESKWYGSIGFAPADIHPLEVDLVLLALLQGAADLLEQVRRYNVRDLSQWTVLQTVSTLYRHQIVVDEATDFSPIQLACMAKLSHPRARSFFACGDFNQRLTLWGSKSIDELMRVLPGLELKRIAVSYRQTRQLNDLANRIIQAESTEEHQVLLPEHVDNDGVGPALAERLGSTSSPDHVGWIADRVREIERFVHQLPSTAVLVSSEVEVVPVAEALNSMLRADNIKVVPCPLGQAMGQDNDIRVFDVQHIKGLEFEAVFFVAIDRLAANHSDLLDKYLYVGATRAATYLGITCQGSLPVQLESVRAMFVSEWKG